MSRIIVTRISAMGDVAMVASVLKELQQQHPELEIIMVTKVFFKPFFRDVPRLTFHAIEPKVNHKGLKGLYKLYKELNVYNADAVADLHDSLRTKIISRLFKIAGKKVAVIDKGRKEKKALTREQNKVLTPLKPTTERYADVFRELGFDVHLKHQLQKEKVELPRDFYAIFHQHTNVIGIAPFAQHTFKVLPMPKMTKVIEGLSYAGFRMIIFGGGKEEKEIAEKWEKKFDAVYSSIGKLNLSQELDVIAHLDLMISMDSSGMHMASLMGTRCVSVWGATHPFAGFLGYGQSMEDCVQVEHHARPSSVYGNKPCDCDGVEAIDLVMPEMIVEKVKGVLQ